MYKGFYEFSQFALVKCSSGGDELCTVTWGNGSYRQHGWLMMMGRLRWCFSAYDGTTLIGTSIQPSTGIFNHFSPEWDECHQLNGYKLMGHR